MKKLLTSIIFIILIFAINFISIYAESKYRDNKQKIRGEEKFNIYKPVTNRQNTEQEENISIQNIINKKYLIGVIFHPKNNQRNISSFEDNFFKSLGDTFIKTENVELCGQNAFKKIIENANTSERAIALLPENLLGMSIDVNGILIITYSYDSLNKLYTIETKFVFIDGGNIYKLKPEEVKKEDLDKTLDEFSNSITNKIKTTITNFIQTTKSASNADANDHFEKGKSFNLNKLYSQAIKELELSIQIDPKNPKAHLELSFAIYMSSKDRLRQIDVLKYGVKMNPNNFELHLELGKTYALVGDKVNAKDEYNYIIIMDKNGTSEFHNQAESLLNSLNFE
ncbi:hypothetical protein HZA55_02150 [Candidatus Poribacteria bacterium]|nr:hypothetical protein [Candidatus Poribacteria bacterium]